MVEVWFAILCLLLTLFAVLEGWDFGAGALHLVVAKTGAERRQVIAAIGPLWSWNEVWLLAAGGVFMVAFPKAMATAFAGYYLALWLALWSFMLRGISLEVGGHLQDPLWQSFWDLVFAVSNFLLAFVFGAALGNVIRGVPLDETGAFTLAFFTHFGVRGRVGILDWYTLSVGVTTLLLLCAHGATYLVMKTQGAVHERSERWATGLWRAVAVAFPIVTLETGLVRPDLLATAVQRPLAWIGLFGGLAGLAALITGRRRKLEQRAFVGSCIVIASLLGVLVVGLFPVLLRSTIAPEFSMTAQQAASSPRGLRLALFWWPVAFLLAMSYVRFIARQFRGKISSSQDTQGYH